MIINYNKTEIPVTKNAVFAIRLDTDADREHIIIGELSEVLHCLQGVGGEIIVCAGRSFGAFIEECSTPIIGQFAREEMLKKLWQSDNLVYRYAAVRIWQEFHKAYKESEEDLYRNIKAISLPLTLNLKESILKWQVEDPQNPMGFLPGAFFVHPPSILYTRSEPPSEYMAANLSLLPLVVYYMKNVYNTKTYFQACKRCGKLFRAQTAHIPTFCSDDCKKEQNRENRKRYDEKAKNEPCEAAYKTNYMYWYNRIKKLREIAPGTERLAEAERAFDIFCEDAIHMKKAVASGKIDMKDCMGWLVQQRDTIDGFMESDS